MKFLSYSILFLVCSLASFSAGAQSVTPFNTQVSSDGTEVISDFLLMLGDGSSEVYTARFDDNAFQVLGSSTIPPTSTGPIQVSVRDSSGGSGPIYDPHGGIGGAFPSLRGSTQRGSPIRGDGQDTQWVPVLIWAGAGLVTAGACASGWYATKRALISSCRAQGRGWDRISIGRCGIAGASSIECEEEPDDEGSNVLSWSQFGQLHLPSTYAIDQYIFQLQIPSNDGF